MDCRRYATKQILGVQDCREPDPTNAFWRDCKGVDGQPENVMAERNYPCAHTRPCCTHWPRLHQPGTISQPHLPTILVCHPN